ncbi:hypothetical protein [Streptomyces sp. NPDC057877]|uniref:hypothetical protein n=1 Tax=Streptomyces sp. NPDC057877 TaxID=3346269 RepID=UPI0036CC0ECB
MTDTPVRPIPTPGDLTARRCGTPLAGAPAPVCQAPAEPDAAATPLYDRRRWERALLATRLPHQAARLLGWGLAHLADSSGYLPAGGPQNANLLGRTLRMSGKQVRMSLNQLEQAGLITRPDIHTWEPQDVVRPITLTLPAAPARPAPPSTAQAAG